jgi:cardiolipin synthase A/B
VSLPILFLAAHAVGLWFFGRLLLSEKSHASLILWTLWLLLFPLLGVPLYLLLGTEKIHREKMERFETLRFSPPTDLGDSELSETLRYLRRVNGQKAVRMAVPELLWNGEEYYAALCRDIARCRVYAHIQTYVWREDAIGRRVLARLCRAARRGVEVRILLDEMGSVKTSRGFFKPLERAGGRFQWSSTVQTRRSRFFFNLRNHRKVNILDGRTAYLGGMNIGEEYCGRAIGPWQDLVLRLRGPVVLALQTSFAEDWAFASREPLDAARYLPAPREGEDPVPVVLVQTGPDRADRSFLKTFSVLCMQARERLDLFTPYFVPNEHMLWMLKTTAARGVRVRLLIPTLNEHMYMVDIGRANYPPLLRDGVEIYELPGMVHHAKAFRVDGDLVFAGSHNLDIRSAKLNFELSVCFHHAETAARLDRHFDALFARAHRIDAAAFARRPLALKLRQGAVRLFGPVL